MNSTINILSPYLYSLQRNLEPTRGSTASSLIKKNRIVVEPPASSKHSACPDTGKLYILSDFTERTNSLLDNINTFEFPEGSSPELFRTVYVSDTDKATASVMEGAKTGTYLLDIKQTAGVEKVNSLVLPENDPTELSDGEHHFTLNINGTEYSLSIDVDKTGPGTDTNSDVLEKLARVISGVDSSIEADVIKTERKVYSSDYGNLYEDAVYLAVKSKDSGSENEFSLRDTNGSIIEKLGLDRIAVSASDARYSVNGFSASAPENSISCDEGRLTVNLIDQTGRRVDISVEKGFDPLENSIKELVDQYNRYIEWIDENNDCLNTVMTCDIGSSIKSLEDDLKSIGIDFMDDNRLEITDSFDHSLRTDTDTVRNVLSGDDGLFANIASDLNRVLESVSDLRMQAKYKRLVYGNLDLFA